MFEAMACLKSVCMQQIKQIVFKHSRDAIDGRMFKDLAHTLIYIYIYGYGWYWVMMVLFVERLTAE